MKKEINAIVLVLAFPILLLGCAWSSYPLSIIGVSLVILDAIAVIVAPKNKKS